MRWRGRGRGGARAAENQVGDKLRDKAGEHEVRSALNTPVTVLGCWFCGAFSSAENFCFAFTRKEETLRNVYKVVMNSYTLEGSRRTEM